MARVIVHEPKKVTVRIAGYTGTPTGDIELTENNRTYNVSPFATATTAIPEEEKTVTPSTVKQTVTPDNGLLKKVTVEPTPLESKTVAPTTEQQTILPQSPAIGFSQFTVEPMPAPPVLIEKTITENDTYTAAEDNADGYSVVKVNIQPYYNSQGTMYFADMVIPDTVTDIKSGAYQRCPNMQTLEIAGTVKTVGSYAFQNCPITSLVLNYGIEIVQEFVFTNHACSTVFIPSSVKNIGVYSFSSTTANQVYDLSAFIDPNNIPTLQSNAFVLSRIESFLVANQEMLDAFESATNWSAGAGKYVIKGATS